MIARLTCQRWIAKTGTSATIGVRAATSSPSTTAADVCAPAAQRSANAAISGQYAGVWPTTMKSSSRRLLRRIQASASRIAERPYAPARAANAAARPISNGGNSWPNAVIIRGSAPSTRGMTNQPHNHGP